MLNRLKLKPFKHTKPFGQVDNGAIVTVWELIVQEGPVKPDAHMHVNIFGGIFKHRPPVKN